MVIIEQCDCTCGCRTQDANDRDTSNRCSECMAGRHDMALWAIQTAKRTDAVGSNGDIQG
jgi:hypothetical protein